MNSSNNITQKPRYVAFSTHLVASIIIASSLMLLLVYQWFPGALFAATGGLDGIIIILAVDLVLGPLLTLVVFNPQKTKSHLAIDLSIIACIQLACLFAGIYLVYKARPLAIVHVYDTFHVLNESSFTNSNIPLSKLDEIEAPTPKILYVDVGNNATSFAISKISNALNKLSPSHLQVKNYKTLPISSGEINKILESGISTKHKDCITQNISSLYRNGTVLFNTKTFEFSEFKENTSLQKTLDSQKTTNTENTTK